ncbi:hypothetical protein D5S17_13615 [Pseudonocardiaceae bacterium YIM PH 21723]|nr:hypothetical protein D5S17_13615 [Pseudonocardiaceae bacterium YIM PH 21723]
MASRTTIAAALLGTALAALGVVTVAQEASTSSVTTVAQAAAAAPTLQVSKTKDLNPNGEKVTVNGKGYNLGSDKGIYVAVCVIPKAGERPTPCIGGGNPNSGQSAWVRDTAGATTKTDASGNFTVSISAAAVYGSTDCRKVKCAMATQRDHDGFDDRSFDVLIPLTFKAS